MIPRNRGARSVVIAVDAPEQSSRFHSSDPPVATRDVSGKGGMESHLRKRLDASTRANMGVMELTARQFANMGSVEWCDPWARQPFRLASFALLGILVRVS